MAKKASLTDVGTGYSSNTVLNNNFTNLNNKLDNTLSLDGSTPNAMNADLDMNSNDILNVDDLSLTGFIRTPAGVVSAEDLYESASTSISEAQAAALVLPIENRLGEYETLEDNGWDWESDADASTALSAVLDKLILAGGGTLVVSRSPRIDTQVVKTISSEIHIDIRGRGLMTTGFRGNNTSGVLSITSTNRAASVTVSDMYFEPMLDGAGKAIELVWPSGGSQDQHMISLNRLLVQPRDDTSAFSWNDPLVTTGAYRLKVTSVFVDQGANSSTKMGYILDCSDCYKPFIQWNYFKGPCDTSVYSDGTNEEAFNFSHNTVVGGDRGVVWKRTGREPEMFFAFNHINCVITGVQLDGVKYGIIQGNLMYCQSDAQSNYVDFRLLNCEGIDILNNTYRQAFAASRVHIDLWPSGSQTAGSIVSNIRVDERGLFATALWHVQVRDNCTKIEITQPDVSTLSTLLGTSYGSSLTTVSGSGTSSVLVMTPTTISGKERSTLDKGTWTPSLTFGGGNTGLVASTAIGKWVRSGDMIQYFIDIDLTAKGTSTGQADISLPNITGYTNTDPTGAALVPIYSNMSLVTNILGRMTSELNLRLVTQGMTQTTSITDANFTDTSQFVVTGLAFLEES